MFIGDPLSDLPLYACLLKDDTVIFVEYIFPNAAILRQGDWEKFERLYAVADEYGIPMFSIMHDGA